MKVAAGRKQVVKSRDAVDDYTAAKQNTFSNDGHISPREEGGVRRSELMFRTAGCRAGRLTSPLSEAAG
ncbi:hypothetical protein DPEC_G00196450 [Dallia pectoralis]|uniref:Uncharacterized protein n=1 Tax=Dallia pectoralis TaxID=75939 RepID=A0ACC2G841_DALPE|nr:hypothetical protein DPEC_G00196450 [Dallia pectoralis]